MNIASTAGRGGFAGAATYSGTKHFVVGASEAVRFELRASPVEISCIMPVVVNTELAAGASNARFVAKLEPDDVADAVVRTLRFPRFEVFVPRYMSAMMTFAAILPRPAREGLARALKADQVFMTRDDAARREYELRAARSSRRARAARGAARARARRRRLSSWRCSSGRRVSQVSRTAAPVGSAGL